MIAYKTESNTLLCKLTQVVADAEYYRKRCEELEGETKSKRGRPPSDSPRSVKLQVRVTEEENLLIQQAAGESVSDWARQVLVKAARKKI